MTAIDFKTYWHQYIILPLVRHSATYDGQPNILTCLLNG
jgi:hypothetical protein